MSGIHFKSAQEKCRREGCIVLASFRVTRGQQAILLISAAVTQDPRTPLNVAEMEALTGLTGRALRYAFSAAFNCSSLEWQRNTRLDLARQALLSSSKPQSIKRLAFDFGFRTPRSFTRYYEARFREHPTQTYLNSRSAAFSDGFAGLEQP